VCCLSTTYVRMCKHTWVDLTVSSSCVFLSAGLLWFCTSPCEGKAHVCVWETQRHWWGFRVYVINGETDISLSCCSREACSCRMPSCSWANSSSWQVCSSSRDNSSLVIFSLTFSSRLSCCSLWRSRHCLSNWKKIIYKSCELKWCECHKIIRFCLILPVHLWCSPSFVFGKAALNPVLYYGAAAGGPDYATADFQSPERELTYNAYIIITIKKITKMYEAELSSESHDPLEIILIC